MILSYLLKIIKTPKTVLRSERMAKSAVGVGHKPRKSKIVTLKKSYSEFLGFRITAVKRGNGHKTKYVVRKLEFKEKVLYSPATITIEYADESHNLLFTKSAGLYLKYVRPKF